MTNGVVIKVDTSLAQKAQDELGTSTKALFAIFGQQDKLIQQIEQHLRAQAAATDATAAAQDRAAQAAARAAAAQRAAREAEQRSFGQFGVGLNPTLAGGRGGTGSLTSPGDGLTPSFQKTAEAAKETQKAAIGAAAGVAAAGASAASAAPLMQKLFAAAGQSGAAKGLGILGTFAKTAVLSLNPVGIASGLAAGALLTLALNAASAETPLQKLRSEAREAQKNFDLLAESSGNLGQALKAAAGARQGTFGIAVGDTKAQVQALEEFRAKLAALKKDVGATDFLAGGQSFLNVAQIKDAAVALNLPIQAIRDLGEAARVGGKEQERLIARIRESTKLPLQLRDSAASIAGGGPRDIVVEAAEAEKRLQDEIDATDAKIRERQKLLRESVVDYEKLIEALDKERERFALGNKVRETQQKLDDLALASGGKLTELQKQKAAVALSLSRAIDGQVEAEKKRKEAEQESERITKALADRDERRRDALQRLNDETNIALATTEEEIRQKERLAEVNAILAQIGPPPKGTTESDALRQEIEAAVARKSAAEEYRQKLQEVRDVGADAFRTIGQNILSAAESGANFRQFLQGVARDLAQLAAQKAIVDSLAKLGSAAFGSLFGPSAPTTPGSTGQQLGGILPNSGQPTVWAARGLVLDRAMTLLAGNTNVNVAEGGASAPEAILPLGRDNYGRLGVRAAEGGGGTTIINMPNVRSAEEARRVRPTMEQTLESVHRRNRRSMRAGQ